MRAKMIPHNDLKIIFNGMPRHMSQIKLQLLYHIYISCLYVSSLSCQLKKFSTVFGKDTVTYTLMSI